MGRPRKTKLEQFPINTDMFNDIRIKKLVAAQTGAAVTVYIALLCSVHANGYYMRWDKDKTPVSLSAITGFKEAYIAETVKCCLATGLFSKQMFQQHSVITSREIQEQYIRVKLMHRLKPCIKEYSLINNGNEEEEEEEEAEAKGNVQNVQPQTSSPIGEQGKGQASPPPAIPPQAQRTPATNEDEWQQELMHNQSFIETTAMRFKACMNDILAGLHDFQLENRAKNTTHANYTDYRRHAVDWLRYWIKNHTNQQNNGNNQPGQQDKRRAAPVTADSAEDYTTSF